MPPVRTSLNVGPAARLSSRHLRQPLLECFHKILVCRGRQPVHNNAVDLKVYRAHAHAHPRVSAAESGLSSFAYSVRVAASRCCIVMTLPSSAARKAPCSAMLRMTAPVTLSCASRAKSSGPVGAADGNALRQMRSRLTGSGKGKCTMKRSRRSNACINRVRHVRRQDGDAAIRLHALQQVADLNVGVTVERLPRRAALAEQRVRLVETEGSRRSSPPR